MGLLFHKTVQPFRRPLSDKCPSEAVDYPCGQHTLQQRVDENETWNCNPSRPRIVQGGGCQEAEQYERGEEKPAPGIIRGLTRCNPGKGDRRGQEHERRAHFRQIHDADHSRYVSCKQVHAEKRRNLAGLAVHISHRSYPGFPRWIRLQHCTHRRCRSYAGGRDNSLSRPPALQDPAPLSPCGRGAGGEGFSCRVKRGREAVAREIDPLRLESIEVAVTGADGKSAAGPLTPDPSPREGRGEQELRATGLKSPGHHRTMTPSGGQKLIWKTIQHLI
jgi:hypothetical protein